MKTLILGCYTPGAKPWFSEAFTATLWSWYYHPALQMRTLVLKVKPSAQSRRARRKESAIDWRLSLRRVLGAS